jgi:hypothetical protein
MDNYFRGTALSVRVFAVGLIVVGAAGDLYHLFEPSISGPDFGILFAFAAILITGLFGITVADCLKVVEQRLAKIEESSRGDLNR